MDLIVPPDSLLSPKTFREWFKLTHDQLFGKPEVSIELIESMLATANGVFNNQPYIPLYKEKNRKVSSKLGDVFCVTIEIIMSKFEITYSQLGKIIGLHHATLIYYRKRHEGHSTTNKKYYQNYQKTIKLLEDERVIPIIETKKSNSKWILSDVLS